MSESNGRVVHKGYATSRPFLVEEVEGEPPVQYLIKPMKQRAKSEWQGFMADRVKYNTAGKPVGVTKFDGLEASLICRCLYGPDGTLVSESKIEDWLAPVVTAAFKECQDINGLTPEAEDAAKK